MSRIKGQSRDGKKLREEEERIRKRKVRVQSGRR